MEIQWPLAIFSLLAGCGGGLVACTGVSEWLGKAEKTRFVALVSALALLIVGGCASILHLAHPESIMAAAANIFSFSGISVELIMLGVNCVVAIAYLAMLRMGAGATALKAIGCVSVVTGVLMAFVVGNGYVMEAQGNWDTILLPLGYLASGLACGTTLWLALESRCGDDAAIMRRIGAIAIGACALQLILFVAYGSVPGFGRDPFLLVGGAIAVGSVGSLACGIVARKVPAAWWGAFACALVGGLCFRAFMWVVGDGFMAAFALAAGRTVLGV